MVRVMGREGNILVLLRRMEVNERVNVTIFLSFKTLLNAIIFSQEISIFIFLLFLDPHRRNANMHTAEAVSATINTNRNCTVEITNVSSFYSHINPK